MVIIGCIVAIMLIYWAYTVLGTNTRTSPQPIRSTGNEKGNAYAKLQIEIIESRLEWFRNDPDFSHWIPVYENHLEMAKKKLAQLEEIDKWMDNVLKKPND